MRTILRSDNLDPSKRGFVTEDLSKQLVLLLGKGQYKTGRDREVFSVKSFQFSGLRDLVHPNQIWMF